MPMGRRCSMKTYVHDVALTLFWAIQLTGRL